MKKNMSDFFLLNGLFDWVEEVYISFLCKISVWLCW